MKRVGAYMAVIGLATLILPYLGYELRLFSALDDMGTTGLIIKIALVVVGGVLFFKASSASNEEQISEDSAAD